MICLVHHLLSQNPIIKGSKKAIICKSNSLVYEQLNELTNQLANGLRNNGLKRGDRVGIYMEKCINEVISIIAVSKAGGVFVPINHLLFRDQVKYIINDCNIKVLISTYAKLKILDFVLDNSSLEMIITSDNCGDIKFNKKILQFKKILSSESSNPLTDVCISKDLGAILYTSGSTGMPKGVMLSHKNLLAGSRIVSKYLNISAKDRLISVLAFSFDYGLNQLFTSLQNSSTLVLLNFTFPAEIAQTLTKEKITGFAGVPTLWRLISQPSSSFRRYSYPQLRYLTNTGGAVPCELTEELRKIFPTTQIFLMYGLTEAFRSTYLHPDELDRRPGSMGKAIPDTEIFVLNKDGELCGPNEIGELVHRGPTVSMGYWGKPDATASVFRPNPILPAEIQSHQKVCYSGDLVKTDEEGFLYYVGRRDNTIKSSGFRISPTEVENVLYSTKRIRDVAVIGVADDNLGQAIKALVVLNEGEEARAEEFIEFCAVRLPRYMIPRYLEIINDMPKTGHGKIDYPLLLKRENKHG